MSEQSLPHWQLTSIYDSLDAAEFASDKHNLAQGVAAFERLLDERGVRAGGAAGSQAHTTIEAVIERLLATLRPLLTLNGYLNLRVSVDATDDAAQAERSALTSHSVRLLTLRKRFTAWLAEVDLDSAADASEVVAAHRHFLEQERVSASHLLAPEAEAVAIALDDTGGSAWARLYNQLVSRRTIRAKVLDESGTEGEYGVAELRVLQAH